MNAIKQLSIFLENKPGMIRRVCEVLHRQQISILTMTLADTAQFGILRFLVRETKEAKEAKEAKPKAAAAKKPAAKTTKAAKATKE